MSGAATWQDLLVTGAAVLAAGWLVAGRIRRRRSAKCAGCALAEAAARGAEGASRPGSVTRPPPGTPSAR